MRWTASWRLDARYDVFNVVWRARESFRNADLNTDDTAATLCRYKVLRLRAEVNRAEVHMDTHRAINARGTRPVDPHQ